MQRAREVVPDVVRGDVIDDDVDGTRAAGPRGVGVFPPDVAPHEGRSGAGAPECPGRRWRGVGQAARPGGRPDGRRCREVQRGARSTGSRAATRTPENAISGRRSERCNPLEMGLGAACRGSKSPHPDHLYSPVFARLGATARRSCARRRRPATRCPPRGSAAKCSEVRGVRGVGRGLRGSRQTVPQHEWNVQLSRCPAGQPCWLGPPRDALGGLCTGCPFE